MDAVVLPLNRMARRVGVPAKWLKAEAEAGRIPHVKAGKRYIFNAAAVARVLAERADRIESEVAHA